MIICICIPFIKHDLVFKCINYILDKLSSFGSSYLFMVNPRDWADASRNKPNEIITVYLVNRSVYIRGIQIKMIYSRIKKGLEGK